MNDLELILKAFERVETALADSKRVADERHDGYVKSLGDIRGEIRALEKTVSTSTEEIVTLRERLVKTHNFAAKISQAAFDEEERPTDPKLTVVKPKRAKP